MPRKKQQQLSKPAIYAIAQEFGNANTVCHACDQLVTCKHLDLYVKNFSQRIPPMYTPCSGAYARTV
jgi:hypothetical protein